MPLPIAPSAMTILYLCVFSFGFIGAFLRFTYIIKTFKFDAKTGSHKHYVAYESNRTKQTGMHRFKGSLSTRQINNIQLKRNQLSKSIAPHNLSAFDVIEFRVSTHVDNPPQATGTFEWGWEGGKAISGLQLAAQGSRLQNYMPVGL